MLGWATSQEMALALIQFHVIVFKPKYSSMCIVLQFIQNISQLDITGIEGCIICKITHMSVGKLEE